MYLRFAALAVLLLLGGLVPARGQDVDYTKLIQAPARLYLGKGLAVGMRYERATKTLDQEVREFMAVVGETEAHWEIETNQGLAALAAAPGAAGLTLALVVEKQTFKVLSARIGKAGATLQAIVVLGLDSAPPPLAATKPERSDELALPSGKKVKAEVHPSPGGAGTTKVWLGAQGTPLAGIWLGTSGEAPIHLSEDPAQVSLEVTSDDPETPLKLAATKTVFDNGLAVWTCADPTLLAFNQASLRSETKFFATRIVSVQTKAAATLTWK